MTPPHDLLVSIAREFADARHVPKRTCLGCGHTVGGADWFYVQCDGRGLEFIGRAASIDDMPRYRVSWAQVQRLTAGQTAMALA